jgi:hypothetical protein
MKDELHLDYRLEDGSYGGTIWSRKDDQTDVLTHFWGRSFAQMMSKLAKRLRESEEGTTVHLTRLETDKEIKLDKATVELLRTDPAAAIRMMHVPDRTVVVRDPVSGKEYGEPLVRRVMRSQLRAGHDTLADAFGERVYCRRKGNRVEDPVTGRWSKLCRTEFHRPPEPGQVYVNVTVYQGDMSRLRAINPEQVSARLEIPWYEASEDWLTTRTANLIAFGVMAGSAVLDSRGFYIPRRWNKSGAWISHEDLEKKHRAFEKERANV